MLSSFHIGIASAIKFWHAFEKKIKLNFYLELDVLMS